MTRSLKKRVWAIVEPAQEGDRLSSTFDYFIIALIFLNILAVILESVSWMHVRFEAQFDAFEVFSVAVFTVEYIARVWSCVVEQYYAEPVVGRLRFVLRPLIIIDLLAFLPFYLSFIGVDTRILRSLRLFRILRILKLGRYLRAFHTIRNVLLDQKEELVLSVFTLVILLILSASFMYFAEHDAQPDNFASIPGTIWWSVVTLTTVGYGDVYPVTVAGKVIAGVISILGIGMVALPAGIISSGFVEEVKKSKINRLGEKTCPRCNGTGHIRKEE